MLVLFFHFLCHAFRARKYFGPVYMLRACSCVRTTCTPITHTTDDLHTHTHINCTHVLLILTSIAYPESLT